MPDCLRYRDDIEQPADDEAETIRKIVEVVTTGMLNVRAKYGRDVDPPPPAGTPVELNERSGRPARPNG